MPVTRKTASKRSPKTAPQKQETTEALGYIRVSSQDQADSGLSMEAQRARIEGQAAANGWTLIGIYEDAGISAKTLDRPGLQAALKKLKPGRVLLALKLDRLTRSVRDLYDLTKLIDEAGADWACVQEKFDTTTATGRLILAIMVQLSQWERETISERTISALGVKKTKGERLGTTPLGFRTVTDEDGVTRVEVDEDEMQTVALVRQLHDEGRGLSLRKIARVMEAGGHKTKRGGKWGAETVSRLLQLRYIEQIVLS